MVASAEDVLHFWLDEVGPEGWYKQSDSIDTAIRQRFEPTVRAARGGRLDNWMTRAEGALALLIVLDQFP
ncbi:MAG: DUF924 family protein, partial [Pseudomonadota bacterium]